MIKSYYLFFMFALVASFFFIGSASAITPDWYGLTSDYIDTDDDGEKDHYLSYDEYDNFMMIDTLVDFEPFYAGGFTVLTLGSDPDTPAIFGNILDSSTVMKGKGIILDIRIITTTEEDGDEKEIYDITSVRVLTGTGGSQEKDEPSSDSDPLSTIAAVAICCLPQIVIPLIIGGIVTKIKRDKKGKESFNNPNTNNNLHPNYASGPINGAGWNQRGSYGNSPGMVSEPPGAGDSNSQQNTSEDDMKGLEDFMASMKTEK